MEEAKALMYRAMIAQVGSARESWRCRPKAAVAQPLPYYAQGKYAVVKGDVKADAPSGLQAVKNLARFLHTKRERYGGKVFRSALSLRKCPSFWSMPTSAPIPHHRDDVLAIVKKQMEDGISLHNPTVALMNASILSRAGVSEEEKKKFAHDTALSTTGLRINTSRHLLVLKDNENALRCLHNSSNVEAMSLTIQILLAMDRVDLAK